MARGDTGHLRAPPGSHLPQTPVGSALFSKHLLMVVTEAPSDLCFEMLSFWGLLGPLQWDGGHGGP